MNTMKTSYSRASPSRALSTSMRVPMSGAAPVDSYHSTFDESHQASSLIEEAKRDLRRLKRKTAKSESSVNGKHGSMQK